MTNTQFRLEVLAAMEKHGIRVDLERISSRNLWDFETEFAAIRKRAKQFCACPHPAEERLGRMCLLCDKKIGTLTEVPA